MRFVARAPGKLVVLGEYAVLSGAPALVMAVDRYCRASIGPSTDTRCHLRTCRPEPELHDAEIGEFTGVALVDGISRLASFAAVPAWSATLDSAPLYSVGAKLGLGSSAAALCAWAGVWAAYADQSGVPWPEPSLHGLIEVHRAFQHGAGSGLDVAASFTGGVVAFRLDEQSAPHISSVRLPNSVGFAGVFPGSSASTPGLVARYHSWAAEQPKAAAEHRRTMGNIAEAGCAAAREDKGDDFLGAVADYGQCLDGLGRAMGVDIVTAEHREIETMARRHGVVYKVSGAGGGDLGLAFSSESDALAAFKASVSETDYHVIEFELDQHGLVVEELTD